ncbi:MAG TPA: flagellar hook-basal body complex protein FliE [Burkholderiaceae bacterium]|jgi:flagellar hook-basal body complex protein FliE|nr:flagellar hook-basal body complex protein FliE [Burkholderiaceae bacterium]
MDLGSINAQIATAVAGAPAASSAAALTSEALAKEAAGKGFDFASSLDAALKAVSHSQAQSDELQRQFALQNPDVGLEDTVVAMSKASISFAAAVQVRNRLVQAYDQIMNMPV